MDDQPVPAAKVKSVNSGVCTTVSWDRGARENASGVLGLLTLVADL